MSKDFLLEKWHRFYLAFIEWMFRKGINNINSNLNDDQFMNLVVDVGKTDFNLKIRKEDLLFETLITIEGFPIDEQSNPEIVLGKKDRNEPDNEFTGRILELLQVVSRTVSAQVYKESDQGVTKTMQDLGTTVIGALAALRKPRGTDLLTKTGIYWKDQTMYIQYSFDKNIAGILELSYSGVIKTWTARVYMQILGNVFRIERKRKPRFRNNLTPEDFIIKCVQNFALIQASNANDLMQSFPGEVVGNDFIPKIIPPPEEEEPVALELNPKYDGYVDHAQNGKGESGQAVPPTDVSEDGQTLRMPNVAPDVAPGLKADSSQPAEEESTEVELPDEIADIADHIPSIK